MALVQEIRCDFCDAVLVGVKGITKISRSYLEIAGFVRDWVADPDSGWRTPTYISHPDKRPMAFCSDRKDGKPATCLQDYVHMKRESWRVRREQMLRDGATAEAQERLLDS